MPRKAVAKKPVTEAKAPVIKKPNTVGFKVKQNARWNIMQAAGIKFTKSDIVEVNADDIVLPQLRSCDFLEEV